MSYSLQKNEFVIKVGKLVAYGFWGHNGYNVGCWIGNSEFGWHTQEIRIPRFIRRLGFRPGLKK